MILDGIHFTSTRDPGGAACLYTSGAYADVAAAQRALQAHGFDASEIERMGHGLYCVYGYRIKQGVGR